MDPAEKMFPLFLAQELRVVDALVIVRRRAVPDDARGDDRAGQGRAPGFVETGHKACEGAAH